MSRSPHIAWLAGIALVACTTTAEFHGAVELACADSAPVCAQRAGFSIAAAQGGVAPAQALRSRSRRCTVRTVPAPRSAPFRTALRTCTTPRPTRRWSCSSSYFRASPRRAPSPIRCSARARSCSTPSGAAGTPASHTDYPDIFSSGFVFNGAPTSFHEYGIPEGTGNLLDSACVLGTSEVANGTNHGFANFPLLVAGRAQGALVHPSVHVAAPGENTARIALTCLRAMGIAAPSWGSEQFLVTEPFAELLV